MTAIGNEWEIGKNIEFLCVYNQQISNHLEKGGKSIKHQECKTDTSTPKNSDYTHILQF